MPRLFLLACLYFSQGLPFGFFVQALPVLLRTQGRSLGEIGLTSLLALPWGAKFLWAPLVDRIGSRTFGRRRSWIVPLQIVTALALGALAFFPSAGSLSPLLVMVFVTNLLAATQDIATDGLAVDILDERQRGLANGIQVGGYRIGMVVGGGAILMAFERIGWKASFLVMAGLIGVASIPILVYREPPARPREASAPEPSHFLLRKDAPRIIALLALYKIGEAFAAAMLRPMLVDRGLGLADVGLLLGTWGFASGLTGAVLGGALVNRLGRKRALLTFATLQTCAVSSYLLIALGYAGTGAALYVICSAEHLFVGMATAALFTSMMDWCDPHSAATDYTVQASVVVIATGVASTASGYVAQRVGYPAHFAIATTLALLVLPAVAWLFPKRSRLSS